jgi:DUF4097 and DUF4098 domain-containing protein YvlB
MESRNRAVWIGVVIVVVVLCGCVVLVGAGVAAWLVTFPAGWTVGQGGLEGTVVDRTFEVGASPSLKVDNFAGNVEIRAGGGGEIRVLATKRASARGDLDRIEVEMVQQGDYLLITTRKPTLLSNASVRLEITAPAGTRLDAHTGAGTVDASGLAGGVTVDTGAGSVAVRDLSGEVYVHTGAGSVEAQSVQGSLELDSGSGSLTVKGMDGEINAHTGTGGIDVQEATGLVQLSTGSGSIDYQGSATGDCRFETGSGGIRLSLSADLNAEVDLHTGSGSIGLGFPVVGEISRRDVKGLIGSGGETRIYAQTGSGSIDLIRY